jgi:biopolymer transport protein ExbD
MNVEFSCENCGQEMRADSRHVGRRVRCPGCERLVVVPAAEEVVELEPVEKPKQKGTGDRGRGTGIGEQKAVVKKWEPVAQAPEPPVAAPPIVAPPLSQTANNSLAPPEPPEPPSVAGEGPLLPPARSHPEDLIDMTAMVDIVFFLLIFFLVTSLQALESVMDMPTPQASEGGVSTGRSVADLENDPNYITVRIEDDDSIWVEDTQAFNDQELILRLRAAKNESDGPRGLLVIGHADASHGSAVRVFDAGAAAGVNGISLIVQEGEG